VERRQLRLSVGRRLVQEQDRYHLAGRRDRLFAVGRELDERARGAQTRTYPLQRQTQIDWASPVNNRLLLEAGVNRYRAASKSRTHERPERHDDPAVEQATGLAFRAIDATRLAPTLQRPRAVQRVVHHRRARVKVGFNHTNGWNKFTSESLNPISYRLLNAVPTS